MKWHRDIESYNIAKCFLNVRNGEILEFIERYCNMESGRIPTIPNFILSHSPLNSFNYSRLFQNGPAAAAPFVRAKDISLHDNYNRYRSFPQGLFLVCGKRIA